MINLTPNLQTEYHVGIFKKHYSKVPFAGPGWYIMEDMAILAYPKDREVKAMWHQKYSDTEDFCFYIWYNPAVMTFLAFLTNGPVRYHVDK